MQNSTEFGARLWALRKGRKMSREELGEKLGISYMTIRRWELGERSPRMEEIKQICKVFGIEDTVLLHGTQEVEKIKITLVWDRKDVEGEINMSGNGFSLFLGDDGTVGIKGAAKFTSREALKEAAAAILKELEQGYDFQIQRGLIKAEG